MKDKIGYCGRGVEDGGAKHLLSCSSNNQISIWAARNTCGVQLLQGKGSQSQILSQVLKGVCVCMGIHGGRVAGALDW